MTPKQRTFLAAALGLAATAQAQNYNFSTTTATYADLTGATVISTSGWDNYTWFEYMTPFGFKLFGANQDSLYVIGGWVGLNMHGAGQFQDGEIYFCDAYLIERSIGGASDISVAVTGTAPNRILKLQVRNAGLAFDQSGNEDDYVNAQLWIYESTNVIEIHYGPSSVHPDTYYPFLGPTVGLFLDFSTFISLSGNAASPTASTSIPSLSINGTPANGTVYRFTPQSVGMEEIGLSVTAYPNPSSGVFHVNLDQSMGIHVVSVDVINMDGQVVSRVDGTSTADPLRIDLSDMPRGLYTLRVTGEDGTSSTRVIVQ